MDFFEIFQSNGQNQQMNVHLCNLQMNKYGERVLSCIRSGMQSSWRANVLQSLGLNCHKHIFLEVSN